jgi:hypothetical protein
VELVGSSQLVHVVNNRLWNGLENRTHLRAAGSEQGFAQLGLDGSFSSGPGWSDQRWSTGYLFPLAGPNTAPDPTLADLAPEDLPPAEDPRWGQHQATTWDLDQLFTKLSHTGAEVDSRAHLQMSMTIDNLDAAPVTLSQRFEQYDGPTHQYCVGELQLPFVSRNGRSFSDPRVVSSESLGLSSQGSYSRDPSDPTDRVPAGFADNYLVTGINATGKNLELRDTDGNLLTDGDGAPLVDGTRGRVNLVLPQGDYSLSPRVTYASTTDGQPGTTSTGLPSVSATVRCGEVCSACDDGTSICVNNDFARDECTTSPSASVSGSSRSSAERTIQRIYYVVNGGTEITLCDADPVTPGPSCDDSGDGVMVNFALTATELPRCINDLAIVVESIPSDPNDGSELLSCPWSDTIERLIPIQIPDSVPGCFTDPQEAKDAIESAVSGGCDPTVVIGDRMLGSNCNDDFPVDATDVVCNQSMVDTTRAKVDVTPPHKTGELVGCFPSEDVASAAARGLIADDCSSPVIIVDEVFDPRNSCGSQLTVTARDSCGDGNTAPLSWAAPIDGAAPDATQGTVEDCVATDLPSAERAALAATTCTDNDGGCGVADKIVRTSSIDPSGCEASVDVVCIDQCGNESEATHYDILVVGPAPIATKGTIDSCHASQAGAEAAAEAATSISGGCGATFFDTSTSGSCSADVSVTAVDQCGSRSNVIDYDTRIDGIAPTLEKGAGVEEMCFRSAEDAEEAALAATRINDNCPEVPGVYQNSVGPAVHTEADPATCMGPVSVAGADACGNPALPVDYDVKVDDAPPTVSSLVIEARTDRHQKCFDILSLIAQDNCGDPEIALLSCTGGKLLNHRRCERRNRRSCEIIGDQVCFDLAADINHAYEFTLSLAASDGCEEAISCGTDADCGAEARCMDGTCVAVEEITVHIDSARGECPANP